MQKISLRYFQKIVQYKLSLKHTYTPRWSTFETKPYNFWNSTLKPKPETHLHTKVVESAFETKP